MKSLTFNGSHDLATIMASLVYPFTQTAPSRAFPHKLVFPVMKTFLVKDLGKTLVGCNEGGILPNTDSPVRLMGSACPREFNKRKLWF